MYSTIVLIGPMAAGKSTIAALLAEKLDMPHRSVDEVRWEYYDDMGYDNAKAKQIVESEGMWALMGYWKPFEAQTVERILQEYPDHIIDFGAGHSVYEDEALFVRVQKALAPYPNVILLLPSPDVEHSVAVLNERFIAMIQDEVEEIDPEVLEFNTHFIKHPSNQRLATLMIYTDGKTPEQTADEIAEQLTPHEQP